MKIIQSAEQINFLDERFYTEDGENFYPSVTFILDSYPKGAGYVQWLKDLGSNASEVVQRAAESGSKVHDAINRLLLGEVIAWDDKVYSLEEWTFILKFQTFWATYKPKLIATEESFVDGELGYGGTIDLVCEIMGENWLIDLKTSNAIYDSYDLQKAAYRKLWNKKNTEVPIDRDGIFWFKAQTKGIDKTGKGIQGEGWKLIESKHEWNYNYELFEALLKIWKREHPNAKPMNRVLPTEIKLLSI